MKVKDNFNFTIPFKRILIVSIFVGLFIVSGSLEAASKGLESFSLDVSSVQAQLICNVKDYGAKGDGVTEDTTAIQAAIDDCSGQGGGTVLFPRPGTYISNVIHIKDNVTLKFDGVNMDDVILKGKDDTTSSRFILAENVSNVGIEGPGTIDRGKGGSEDPAPYWIPYDVWYWKHIVGFVDCVNVTVRDIEIVSEDYSVQYCGTHLTASNCTNVLYDNVIIRSNQEGSSNDSIQTTNSGSNITIRNSKIFAGDDSLVFHGTLEKTDFDNVLVQNVYIDGETVQGAVMLTTGGQNSPDGSWQTNMTFEDITVEDSLSGWGWGHGISIWPRGPNVHYENITFRNWEMLGHVPTPFYGVFNYGNGGLDGMTAENIIFEDITIHRTSEYPKQDLEGHGPSVIQHMQSVLFKNITYKYSGGERPPDPNQEKLITFKDIPDLQIINFNILIDGSPVNDPYAYLGFENCGVIIDENEVEDLNQDGVVDIIDAQICVNVAIGEETAPNLVERADVNLDGSVDASDVDVVMRTIMER
jgi:hypothetical protein